MNGRLSSNEGKSKPVLYVSSPVLALEFPNARRIVPLDGEDEPLDVLQSRKYHGRVDATYILLPKAMQQNGKANAIVGSFVDYDRTKWQQIELDNYMCLFQDQRHAGAE